MQNAFDGVFQQNDATPGSLKAFLSQNDFEGSNLLTQIQVALGQLPKESLKGDSILQPLTSKINGIPVFFTDNSNNLLGALAQLQSEANSHVSSEGISLSHQRHFRTAHLHQKIWVYTSTTLGHDCSFIQEKYHKSCLTIQIHVHLAFSDQSKEGTNGLSIRFLLASIGYHNEAKNACPYHLCAEALLL